MPTFRKKGTRSVSMMVPVAKAATAGKRRTTKRKVNISHPSTGSVTRYLHNRNDLNVFPTSKMVKLKYCETGFFTGGAGGFAGPEQIWKLGSIFDPNFALGGHQPYGHDQLAALYRNYQVVGVEIQLDFINMSTPGTCGWGGLQSSNSTYVSTGKNPDALREKPGSVMSMPSAAAGSRQTMNFGYIDLAEIEGVSKSEFMGDDNWGAAFGADPAKTAFLRVNICDIGGSTGFTAQAQITLVYHVKVYGRKTEAQS